MKSPVHPPRGSEYPSKEEIEDLVGQAQETDLSFEYHNLRKAYAHGSRITIIKAVVVFVVPDRFFTYTILYKDRNKFRMIAKFLSKCYGVDELSDQSPFRFVPGIDGGGFSGNPNILLYSFVSNMWLASGRCSLPGDGFLQAADKCGACPRG